MLCKELVKTDLLVADATSAVSEVAAAMRDNNIGFLPICDPATGKILGTITDRDITIRLVAANKPATAMIGSIMTPAPLSCHVDSEVVEAHKILLENRIARLLCVEDNGRLAGILSLSDIAERMPALAADTLRELSRRDLARH